MAYLLVIGFIGLIYFFVKKPSLSEPPKQEKVLSMDESIRQAKSLLRKDTPYQTIDFTIAGYSFDSRQDEIINFHEFELVKLLPEPDNEHDSNAIKVLSLNDIVIGYIPKSNNRQVLALILGKFEYEASIKKLIFTKSNEFMPVIIINFYKTEDSVLKSLSKLKKQ